MRGQFLGLDLAGFDVGLVECVDAEDRSGYRGGNFPAEEFLAEVIRVGHSDVDNGMPCFFECGDFGVLCRVRRGFQSDVGEDPVLAIHSRCCQRFAIHRDDALAQFAGRLRNQLLKPCAEIENTGRRNNRDLVASHLRGRAQNQAQHYSRIFCDRNICLASLDHLLRAIEELFRIKSHRGGRDHAKVRQSRVSPTDRRKPVEDVTEAVALRNLLHFGSRIGDREEAVACLVCAQYLLHAFEEILLVDVRFERAP